MDFLTGIASSIVGEIGKYTIVPIGRQLGYLFYYQSNKNNLDDQIKALDLEIESFNSKIDAAREKGDRPLDGFEEWLHQLEEKSKEAKGIRDNEGHEKATCSCTRGGEAFPFPNLVLRHKLSRKALKMAETIAGVIQKAADYASKSDTLFHKQKNFVAFETTRKVLTEIMEALKDPNLGKIGVYGMGGVGKSTLLKEVARQVQDDGLFTRVVLVTVSNTKDLKSIQQETAEVLGLNKLDGENMPQRAGKLHDRLKDEKKILLILDDIWEKFDLEEAEIYFKNDQRESKILLASRDLTLLRRDMEVEKEVLLKVLSGTEPMTLFKNFVGELIEKPDFKDLAEAIVGEYMWRLAHCH